MLIEHSVDWILKRAYTFIWCCFSHNLKWSIYLMEKTTKNSSHNLMFIPAKNALHKYQQTTMKEIQLKQTTRKKNH